MPRPRSFHSRVPEGNNHLTDFCVLHLLSPSLARAWAFLSRTLLAWLSAVLSARHQDNPVPRIPENLCKFQYLGNGPLVAPTRASNERKKSLVVDGWFVHRDFRSQVRPSIRPCTVLLCEQNDCGSDEHFSRTSVPRQEDKIYLHCGRPAARTEWSTRDAGQCDLIQKRAKALRSDHAHRERFATLASLQVRLHVRKKCAHTSGGVQWCEAI